MSAGVGCTGGERRTGGRCGSGRGPRRGPGHPRPGDRPLLAGRRCTSFTAGAGVEDEQLTRGTIRFRVPADGTGKAASPVLAATDAAHPPAADLTARVVRRPRRPGRR
ncbi:NPCBM/NEW2 domain-containing protein [Streptomyces sp. NRRL S-118]|uniref:NPCBM/NEW2 domain-containing protein n=1 Tax=Streptomyces sp. NRRL S-118 TaxID=1463881 RepID=UPI001F2EC624|nr:NPCBM/NEW2 domain-containing protein [Streptomyces sp. NRRL S-118]